MLYLPPLQTQLSSSVCVVTHHSFSSLLPKSLHIFGCPSFFSQSPGALHLLLEILMDMTLSFLFCDCKQREPSHSGSPQPLPFWSLRVLLCSLEPQQSPAGQLRLPSTCTLPSAHEAEFGLLSTCFPTTSTALSCHCICYFH